MIETKVECVLGLRGLKCTAMMKPSGFESSRPTVSRLYHRDIPSLLEVAAAVGWNFNAYRMQNFINAGLFYGHRVASKSVSSVGLFPYGSDVSAIGIVMVKPEYQRRGWGRALMEVCLEQIKSRAAILIATEMGAPLYSKLGFQRINTVQRWIRTDDLDVSSLPQMQSYFSDWNNSDCVFEMLSVEHVSSLIALDQHLTGMNRTQVLASLLYTDANASPKQLAVGTSGVAAFDRRKKTMEGFALITENTTQIQIGPVLASTDELATQLLQYILQHASRSDADSRKPLRIDVPAHQTSYISRLDRGGWRLHQVSPLMLYGSWDVSRYNRHVFGLIDPAFG